MIRRLITDIVKYNCDDPEKMIATRERFNKKTYLFGIKVHDYTKNINQSFEKQKDTKMGFK